MLEMSPYYNLVIYLCIVALQFLSAFGNGFILLLFQKSSRLRKNSSLRLVLVLAITDLAFAISSIPYLLNYLIFWNPIILDYEGRMVVWLSSPLTIQMKLNLCITTAIAIDRLQAMRWPLYFRNKSQSKFAFITVAIGLCLGIFDVLLENLMDTLARQPGCAAVGCFLSRQFRLYWGTSNMALNSLMLALTLWVYLEFRKLRTHSIAIAGMDNQITGLESKEQRKERKNFQQTNRLSIGILCISIIFLLIPSSLVGLSDLANFEMFAIVGPFYIFGLLLAGFVNSIIYIWLHIELREAAKCILLRRSMATNSSDEMISRTVAAIASRVAHGIGNNSRTILTTGTRQHTAGIGIVNTRSPK